MISQQEPNFEPREEELPIEEIANDMAELLRDKKSEDVVLLKVADRTSLADYFILASVNSVPQGRAVAENLLEKIYEKYGLDPQHTEGLDTVRWILLDYADIIVHIFQKEEREYYSLDKLWYRERDKQPDIT